MIICYHLIIGGVLIIYHIILESYFSCGTVSGMRQLFCFACETNLPQ